eukprot:gene1502-1840_t
METKDAVEEEEPQQEDPEADSSDVSGSDDDSGSEDDSETDSAPEVSDDGEDSPDDEDFDKINVNFEFFDPKESDFHGLKALLHNYLDGQQYDSSPLIDTIIAQSAVGTVVRTGEDEDPIGVMTVLNTHQHKQQPWMQQIRQYLVDKSRDAAVRDAISKAWDSPTTGLIINERLINSPPQLAPPLVQALFDEIGWATEDMQTQEDRQAFQFQHYVLMTRASVAFTFPVEGRAVGKDELRPLRLVLLLPASKVAAARASLDAVVGNMAAQQ